MHLLKKLDVTIGNCLMSAAGSLILAFGLYNIHAFSGVTEGGVLGLTLLFYHHFGISPALSGLILNVICYAFGIKTLGKRFITYSAIAGGAFSLFYYIFEQFPPIYPGISEHPFVAATLGALFVGVGVGLSVRAGGAPGGDDAVAMSLSKITGLKIQWIYLFSDLAVLGLSATYIPLLRLAFSLYTVILSGQIVGFMQWRKKEETQQTFQKG